MDTIWIEFPAHDLERAALFYAAVFDHGAGEIVTSPERTITIIPGTPTVSINSTPGFEPTTAGSLPYFHVADLAAALEAVRSHGGSVLEAPAARGDLGIFSLVTDSEGNGLYLHGAA